MKKYSFLFMLFLTGFLLCGIAIPTSAFAADIIVKAGGTHTVALRSDGTVWAWGDNNTYQLGDGTKVDQNKPKQVAGLTDITSIAAGTTDSIALKSDGTVYTWGFNQLTAKQVNGLSNVTAVAAGYNFKLALKSDGTVWAWGWNTYGQLGDGTASNQTVPVQVKNLKNVKKIAAGYDHSLAITNDGKVWAWGHNNFGQLGNSSKVDSNIPVGVNNLDGVTCIDGGQYYSVAVKSDGTVWAWGKNNNYQLGDGTLLEKSTPVQTLNLTDVASVAGAYEHTLALKKDGTVFSWGYNSAGELGSGSLGNRTLPAPIPNLTGITAIDAGSYHSVAVNSDGMAWAWGRNSSGELGIGSNTTSSTSPVRSYFYQTAVTKLSFSNANLNINVGQSLQLLPSLTPQNASNRDIIWSITSGSSNVAVLTQTGYITGRVQGAVVVRATSLYDTAQYAECTVDVINPVTSIELNKKSLSLTVGSSEMLIPTILPSDASNRRIIWSIISQSKDNMISISSFGEVTAIAAGNAVVRATSVGNPEIYKDCNITVIPEGAKQEKNWIRELQYEGSYEGMAQGAGKLVAVRSDGYIITSVDGDSWSTVSSGTSNSLNDVTYGNGLFVAVGQNGTIITSSDGTSWDLQSSGTTNFLDEVTYRNGLFIAVGFDGTILTSSNGKEWSKQLSGVSASLTSVDYGAGLYVISGTNGLILTSPDAASWTTRSTGTTYPLTGVRFGNGQFIAVGHGFNGSMDEDGDGILESYNEGVTLTSADGIKWAASNSRCLDNVVFCNGLFFVVGYDDYFHRGIIFTSQNGSTWTKWTDNIENAIMSDIDAVEYFNGKYIAVGSNAGIFTSLNLTDWTTVSLRTWAEQQKVCYGEGLFVSVGAKGGIITSPDGKNWTKRASGVKVNLKDIKYGNGVFVAIGEGGTILQSPDGIEWNVIYSRSDGVAEGLTFGNGVFVITFYDQYYNEGPADYTLVRTSQDGLKWSVKYLEKGGHDYKYLSYANGLFFIVNGGYQLISMDASNWIQPQTSDVYKLNKITYGNGIYVGIGDGGNILTSIDGTEWTSGVSPTTENLNEVIFANDMFVAIGNTGVILTSYDGISWTKNESNIIDNLTGISYGNGEILIISSLGNILKCTYDSSSTTLTPKLNKSYMVIQKGQTEQLMPSIAPADTSLTWSIQSQSSADVAEVSSTGFVSAKNEGIAVIRVANAGQPSKYAECTVNVTLPVDKVVINKTSTSIVEGKFELLSASAISLDPSKGKVVFTLQKESMRDLVKVMPGGNVIAGNNEGTAVVRATSLADPTKYAECVVTVKAPPDPGVVVRLSKTFTKVTEGCTDQITANVDVKWSIISDTYNNNAVYDMSNIISIGQEGQSSSFASSSWAKKVTALSPGTAVIRATSVLDRTKYCECVVEVVPQDQKISITGLTLNKSKTNITKKLTEQLIVTLEPVNPYGEPLTWSVLTQSGIDIITVSQTGLVTANNVGNAVVRATLVSNPEIYAECEVTVGQPIINNWAEVSISDDYLSKPIYINGKYFILIDNYSGVLLTSINGTDWVSQSLGEYYTLHDLIYRNGMYIAVGSGGVILTSDNTETWTKRTSGISKNIKGIAYGNGVYVAVFDDMEYLQTASPLTNHILTSKDGITWTVQDCGYENSLNDIIFENGVFTAVGEAGFIITSTDGVHWALETSGHNWELNNIEFANGKYFVFGTPPSGANGEVITSMDGDIWTTQSFDSSYQLNDIAYGNGKYVAVGYETRMDSLGFFTKDGIVLTSADGNKWVKDYSSSSLSRFESISYANGIFLIPTRVGRKIMISQQKPQAIMTLNISEARIKVDQTEQLLATVAGSGIKATWTVQSQSSDNVVTVSESGLVTALKAGTAIIRATNPNDETQFAECTIEITNYNLVSSVEISKAFTYILTGNTEKLNASVIPMDSTNRSIIWTIQSQSRDKVVTISNIGLVTAQRSGTAVIRATSAADSSKYAECSITVADPVLPSVGTYSIESGILGSCILNINLQNVNDTSYFIKIYNKYSKTIIEPDRITNYRLSINAAVYTYLSDLELWIYSDSAGTNKIGEYTLNNSNQLIKKDYGVKATQISLNKSEVVLIVGNFEQLIATILPENTSNSIIWTIQSQSTDNVISISETGVITANKVGTAVIRAACASDPSKYVECKVTVNRLDECFIATAAFGSKYQKDVVVLRQFRDKVLLQSKLGTSFVQLYYKYSPPIADFIRDSGSLRLMIRLLLTPFVIFSYLIMHPALGLLLILILVIICRMTLLFIRKAYRNIL